MRLLALLAVTVFAGVVMAAPVPKALKKSPPSLDGTWEMVECNAGGKKLDTATPIRWIVKSQSLMIERLGDGVVIGKAANYSYSLVKPDGGSANAVNYTLTNGTTPSRSMPGVYEVDGDTLTICWANATNGERPAECKPAQGVMLYVFRRVTDDPKKDK